MATYVVATRPAAAAEAARSRQPHPDLRFAAPFTLALAVFALAVHGYHPFAEDGGLYLAGVEHALDPTLFPHSAAFVLEPTRRSLFAPAVAALVRAGRLGLPVTVLALHFASLWATLFAAWLAAVECWSSRAARGGAVALLACWLGLPVAGTALAIMDPYVTARSLSTPCAILALAAVLAYTSPEQAGNGLRSLAAWAAAILVATLVHPLMAAYALGASLLLLSLRTGDSVARAWRTAALCLSAIALAAAIEAMAPAETPESLRISLTRSYWFLGRWRWFEQLGLVAPLAILALFAIRRRRPKTAAQAHDDQLHSDRTGLESAEAPSAVPTPQRSLAQAALAAGLTGAAVALLFAHAGSATLLVARLQPLRIFQVVYIVMALLLGARLGELVLKRHAWRWALALLLLAAPMFAAARATFPATPHLELPWLAASSNPWVQSFQWIRTHTPADALFALDPDYINLPAEDAHCFRAIAQRSSLADYSKDGGEVSIAPDLAPQWSREQRAQANLDSESDAARRAALRPLGVTWLVLRAAAPTSLDCPYRNSAVKVCRLTP